MGNLAAVVESGSTTKYRYNSSGQLVETIYADDTPDDDTDNPRTVTLYDKGSRERANIDRIGGVTHYNYDAGGQLTETIYPDDTPDQVEKLIQAIAPSQTVETIDWTQVVYPDRSPNYLDGNPRSSTEYYRDGQVKAETDELGERVEYDYDPAGRLSVTRFDENNYITYSYDAAGDRLSKTKTVTTPAGVQQLVTQWAYDKEGRVVSTTDPENNISRYEYDAFGNLTAFIDALENRTEYVYDGRGLLLETIYPDDTPENPSDNLRTVNSYDKGGRLEAATDAEGRITRYLYDPLGRLTETIYPDETQGNDDDNPRTKSEYYKNGSVKAEIDEGGNRTEYRYDALGRTIETIYPDRTPNNLSDNPKTTYKYDAAGQKISETDALGRTTKFVYDELGRVRETRFHDGTYTLATYDAAGNKETFTDEAGKTTSYGYDAVDRLTFVEDAAGGLTEFGYDEVGRLIWVEDANDRRTYYEYNKSDRHSATTLPEGQRSEIFYDAAGNVVGTTNFNGTNIVYEYEYDLDGSAGSQSSTGFRTPVGRAYTATGQIASITDARGTTAYKYDSLDRLLSRTDPSGSYIPSSGATIEYKYDEAGNIAAVTTPTGTVEYSYDERNRLETVTGSDGGNPTIYSYDEVGNLIETKLPNGVTETRLYDDRDRLISLEYTKLNSSGDKEAIASYDYTLDSVGNRLAVREGSDRKVEYEYDDLYRVTQENIFNESGSIERTISYSYDNLGNILTRQDSVEGTTSYTYDDSERLQAAELKKDGAVVSTYSYEYDSNGNIISRLKDGSEEVLYSWDAKNRLVGFEEVLTGRSIDYAYDADGIRVSSTADGKTTNYLVDKNRDYAQVLSEQIDEGLTASYVYGLDFISQQRDDNLSFYQVDGLGSTRALTDAQGNVTDTYRYDAYGNLLGSTGNTANNYLYAGEQYDPNLGHYYLRARYYDPSLGRFNARDPFGGWITEPLSLGKYSYAHGNPVNLTDPSGLSASIVEFLAALPVDKVLAAGAWVGLVGIVGLQVKQGIERLPPLGGFNEDPQPPPSNHTGHDGPVGAPGGLGGFNDGPRERFSDNTASPPGWKEGLRELLEWYLFTIFNEDAYDIAYGHAFEKHKFDSWRHIEIEDPLELAELIDNIMTFPSDVRELEDNRTAYWDDTKKVVVIHDPADSEKGTAFIPSDGKQYFYDLE